MSDTITVRYENEIPDVMSALANIHKAMDTHNFDRTIQHLVRLRASQINKCAYCIKLHTKEARQDGETNERLDRVVVWDQVNDFSDREKSALAWTEALTCPNTKTDLGMLRSNLRKHFFEKEISILTMTIAMINLWNRINISRH